MRAGLFSFSGTHVTPPTPTAVPASLIAGDSWRWDITLADYLPADGWTLKYSIRGPSVLPVQAATPSGDTYQVRIAPADTGKLSAGQYRWTSWVENAGGDRFTVASGMLVVVPNPATVGTVESHAAKMVRFIEAALEGRIPEDMQAFTIGGRSVQQIPILELRQLLGHYRTELRRELTPNRVGRRVEVHFTAPGL